MDTSAAMPSMASSSSSSSSNTSSSSGSMTTMMMSMPMVFTTDHSTPLFSAQWTPANAGSYAATCIFLLVLAVISRGLGAWRVGLERGWREADARRKYVVIAGDAGRDGRVERFASSRGEDEEKEKRGALAARGEEVGDEDEEEEERREGTRTTKRRGLRGPGRGRRREGAVPWRFSTDLPRACVFTVQAGVGYLLMLAVMTLNVGYFLSVLAGLFIGELVVGRYGVADNGHH